MKSKFIFIILLFSLFLNISHDFLIADEVNCECTLSLAHDAPKQDIHSSEALCELHEIFHFSAILSALSDEDELAILNKNLYHTSSIPLTSIHQSTFKPPRV